jgi:hypothetical protein
MVSDNVPIVKEHAIPPRSHLEASIQFEELPIPSKSRFESIKGSTPKDEIVANEMIDGDRSTR